MELQKEETSYEKCDVNAHVSLPVEVIEKMKNEKSWEEWPCQWTYNEEMMSMAWLWYHAKDDHNIHRLYFDKIADQREESTEQ